LRGLKIIGVTVLGGNELSVLQLCRVWIPFRG